MVKLCTCLMVATGAMASASGGDVQGKTNSLVDITLDGNPSTGYLWMIKAIPSQLVYVSTSEDTSGCSEGQVGCPSKTVMSFYATAAGEAKVKLIYGRAWDKSTWEETDYSVHISD